MTIIGIDPSTERTGVCRLYVEESCDFAFIIQEMNCLQSIELAFKEPYLHILAVENPFTNTGHVMDGGNRRYASEKAQGAGYVKGYFRLWEQLAKERNVELLPVNVQTTHAPGQVLRAQRILNGLKITQNELEAMICSVWAWEQKTGKILNPDDKRLTITCKKVSK